MYNGAMNVTLDVISKSSYFLNNTCKKVPIIIIIYESSCIDAPALNKRNRSVLAILAPRSGEQSL